MSINKIALIGARLQELGGFQATMYHQQLKDKIRHQLKELDSSQIHLFTTMDLGPGFWFAELGQELEIPYTAYLPFEKQESKWREDTQEHYHNLLKGAEKVVLCSTGTYDVSKFRVRTQRIMLDADTVWILDPGTNLYINRDKEYATKQGKNVETINCAIDDEGFECDFSNDDDLEL